MPELPEVETVRRTLEPAILGRAVTRVLVHRGDVVRGLRGSSRGATLLEGDRVRETARLGKQLALIGESGRVVLVHLGMTGRMVVRDDSPLAHTHVEWKLEDGTRVAFADARRFGGLWTYASVEELHARRWNMLGPDALSVRSDQLARRLGKTRRPIKAALLDQGVLAGVGNIYADEALFLAKIGPRTRADTLAPERVRDLARAIRRVLYDALRARGTTLRDYVDARGQRGDAGPTLRAYARAGLPCVRCGQTLKGTRITQRTTTYCPDCQRP